MNVGILRALIERHIAADWRRTEFDPAQPPPGGMSFGRQYTDEEMVEARLHNCETRLADTDRLFEEILRAIESMA